MSLAKVFLSAAVLLSSLPASASDALFKTDQFLGSFPNFPLRGIGSGGRPWVLTSIEAKLEAPEGGETRATLKVEVVGLVFADGTIINGVDVSGTRGGVDQYVATLSCLDQAGNTTNVTTRGFDTTVGGDAEIKDRIDVPTPCYAPLVFVRSFTADATGVRRPGNWFAVNGF